MVYSIQEMVSHADKNLTRVRSRMGKGTYHPEDSDIFTGLSRSVERTMRESIRKIPLREFLIKSGTTDVGGAAYLVPTKLHDILNYSSKPFDICSLISMDVVDGWDGGALTVDIVKDESMRAREYGSGGSVPAGTGETVQATITPISFGFDIPITNEMVEDGLYDLISWHVSQAGKAMGYKATDIAVTVLKTGTDGDGTVNSVTTGDVNESKWSGAESGDVEGGGKAIGADEFIPDTMLTTSEAWVHSLSSGVSRMGWAMLPPTPNYDFKVGMFDVVLNNSPSLHASTDTLGAAFTACVTVVFDKDNAMLTGRKRWLQIENYSNPIEDLSGAVVTARQDSVTVYDDSIYVLTESTS